MKKNVIALLLAVIMASSSIGAVPALAVETAVTETTAEEAVAVEEEIFDEQEEVSELSEDSDFGLTDGDVLEEESAQTEEEPVQVDEETVGEANSADEQEEPVDTTVTTEVAEEDEEEDTESTDEGDPSAEIEEEIAEAEENEASLADYVVDSGICGDNATWIVARSGYTAEYILTISGSGAIYDYNNVYDIPWYSYRSEIERVILDGNFTRLGKYVFYECKFESINLPDSITSIGYGAFYGCSLLRRISIPNGVSIIKTGTFRNCYDLEYITIPDSVKYIEKNAISSEYQLKIYINSIESWLSIEGEGTLSGNLYLIHDEYTELLKNIVIPDGTTKIRANAFRSCTSLTSITIPNSVTSIGENAFHFCNGLTDITIPNSVTSIGNYAFENCNGLTTITIPSSVKSIGSYAFENCSRLTNITILGGVTHIGNQAFGGESTNIMIRYNGTKQQWDKAVGDNLVCYKSLICLLLGVTAKVTCANLADNMKVTWEKVPDATSYKVYRDNKLLTTTSLLVIWDKDVKYNVGKKYTYKVVATNKTLGDSKLSRTCTYYRLLPVGIKSLTNPSAGKMTVTYDKCKGCYGYVVRYGLKSDMSDAKVITIKGENTLSRTFGGMQKGKTYYVQARTYILDNGVRYYSTYSTTKKITIKK